MTVPFGTASIEAFHRELNSHFHVVTQQSRSHLEYVASAITLIKLCSAFSMRTSSHFRVLRQHEVLRLMAGWTRSYGLCWGQSL